MSKSLYTGFTESKGEDVTAFFLELSIEVEETFEFDVFFSLIYGFISFKSSHSVSDVLFLLLKLF